MIARLAAAFSTAVLSAVLGLAPLAPPAQAQPVRKTTLQEQPFPGPANRTVLVSTRVAHRAEVAAHTHPGVEMAYVVRGAALVRIAGRPDQRLTPGGSFTVAEGVVHSVKNVGPGPLTIVSTYVVDRTRPLASPAAPAR
jgi:quercetin dioxygenase-like cupin family protein